MNSPVIHSFCQFLVVILAIASLLSSCGEETNPEFEKETFTSIFDDKQFSATYYPVDVRQTPDGGYLVLAERKIADSNFRGVYILKADEFGNFVNDLDVEDHYVNPIGEMIELGSDFYFVAMDALSLQAQIVKADANAESVTVEPIEGMTYPAAARREGNGFLLLSYSHEDKASVISMHNVNGELVKGPKNFGIGAGDDVEEPIINHFLRTGKSFPFLVGKAAEGLYFFNGFENYTFSMVFTDLVQDEPLGVVHGQKDDGGFSAVLPLDMNQYAVSRFNFGENYFLPRVTLQSNGPTAGVFLDGNLLPELVPDARVKIVRADISAKRIVIYASDTKSKQIGLFFYNEVDGTFISSRYLGFSNPFEVAALLQTDDQGLVVCGTTYLAGRFPRICLFKISREQLATQVE
jgi:hypothetical protein